MSKPVVVRIPWTRNQWRQYQRLAQRLAFAAKTQNQGRYMQYVLRAARMMHAENMVTLRTNIATRYAETVKYNDSRPYVGGLVGRK